MNVLKFPSREKDWSEGWRNKAVFGLLMVYTAFFVVFIYQLVNYAGNLMNQTYEQKVNQINEIQE